MKPLISKMLESYEQGKVTRRQLVQGLAAIAAAAQTSPAAGSTFRGLSINHIALRVTNIPRSRDFYRKHFGLPVLNESQSNCFLGLGKDFLALFQNPNAGLDHYCIAIENYQVDAVMQELKRQELNPRRSSDRVYFPDPDGLTVQVSPVEHQP